MSPLRLAFVKTPPVQCLLLAPLRTLAVGLVTFGTMEWQGAPGMCRQEAQAGGRALLTWRLRQ